MPSYLKKYQILSRLYGLLAVAILLLGVLAYYNWWAAAIGLLLFVGLFALVLQVELRNRRETEEYISTLSYRLKKVGEEALLEMPIGIMLMNDDYYIEWTNPYLASCFDEDSLTGRSLYDVAEAIVPLIKQELESETITLNNRKFRVVHKPEERLL